MSMQKTLIHERLATISRNMRELSLLIQISDHNAGAKTSVHAAFFDHVSELMQRFGNGFGVNMRPMPVLELIGYGEDILRCPHCQRRTDFIEVSMRDETGAQLHTCLNPDCQHVFVASADDDETEED